MYGGNAQQTFSCVSKNPAAFSSPAGKVLFNVSFLGQVGSRHFPSAPVLDEDSGSVLVASSDGALRSFFVGNGTMRWMFATGTTGSTPPPLAVDKERGVVYFSQDYLYAVFLANGTAKWKLYVPEGAVTGPAINPGADGTLYMFTWVFKGSLIAISPNGQKLWSVDLAPNTAYSVSSPAVSPDGKFVYGGLFPDATSTRFYSIKAATGALGWAFNGLEDVQFFTSPRVYHSGGAVFVGTRSNLFALDALRGTVGYKLNGTATALALSTDEHSLYFGGIMPGNGTFVSAVFTSDGALQWRVQLSGFADVGGISVNAGGQIIVVLSDGRILGLEPKKGQIVWQVNVGGQTFGGSATASDGTIFITSITENDSSVYSSLYAIH